ncbi:MAG: hypothetical protein AAF514_03200 [Verrucomicrobiota bacterium]
MNLRDQLKDILPDCLPESPLEAIKGTQLIEMVKLRLKQRYSDATLRYHFSIMSCDPSSPIAKVDQGQGYYLRNPVRRGDRESQPRFEVFLDGRGNTQDANEESLQWSKFQAIFERYLEPPSRFPYPFRHPGVNEVPTQYFWTVPDAAVVEWETGEATEEGFSLSNELDSMKIALGDVPFRLTSVKLILEATFSNYLESFFQTLSNSAWAHDGELVIASSVKDEQLAEELRKLGSRHGIGVTSFQMDLDKLDSWANAGAIRSMSDRDFEGITNMIQRHRIVGPTRGTVDWSHLNSLRLRQQSFNDLFQWLNRCRKDGEPYTFQEFEKLSSRTIQPPQRPADAIL